jgi:hypothetical protein
MRARPMTLVAGVVLAGAASIASVVILRRAPRVGITVGANTSGYTPSGPHVTVTSLPTGHANMTVVLLWLAAIGAWAVIAAGLLVSRKRAN